MGDDAVQVESQGRKLVVSEGDGEIRLCDDCEVNVHFVSEPISTDGGIYFPPFWVTSPC